MAHHKLLCDAFIILSTFIIIIIMIIIITTILFSLIMHNCIRFFQSQATDAFTTSNNKKTKQTILSIKYKPRWLFRERVCVCGGGGVTHHKQHIISRLKSHYSNCHACIHRYSVCPSVCYYVSQLTHVYLLPYDYVDLHRMRLS